MKGVLILLKMPLVKLSAGFIYIVHKNVVDFFVYMFQVQTTSINLDISRCHSGLLMNILPPPGTKDARLPAFSVSPAGDYPAS